MLDNDELFNGRETMAWCRNRDYNYSNAFGYHNHIGASSVDHKEGKRKMFGIFIKLVMFCSCRINKCRLCFWFLKDFSQTIV